MYEHIHSVVIHAHGTSTLFYKYLTNSIDKYIVYPEKMHVLDKLTTNNRNKIWYSKKISSQKI